MKKIAIAALIFFLTSVTIYFLSYISLILEGEVRLIGIIIDEILFVIEMVLAFATLFALLKNKKSFDYLAVIVFAAYPCLYLLIDLKYLFIHGGVSYSEFSLILIPIFLMKYSPFIGLPYLLNKQSITK